MEDLEGGKKKKRW